MACPTLRISVSGFTLIMSTLLARGFVVLVCGYALYRSGRMAFADTAAACISCAMQLEPTSELYVARNAIVRDQAGDMSDEVDAELHRALAMNPRDSRVLRSLGMRAEGRGDRTRAESYLLQAATVDHTFQPQWALANFYSRTGQPDRLWPAVHKCLEIIEPRGPDRRRIDPEPVYELCWQTTSDARQILAQVPVRRDMLLPYLQYLVRTGRLDATAEALPTALALPSIESDTPIYLDICDSLLRGNRTAPAVLVWNHLVAVGGIRSTSLEPERGHLLANANFAFPPLGRAFDWQILHDDKIFVHAGEHFVDLEMARSEKEHFELLSKVMPVVGGRGYRLTWRVDASGLDFKSREDPGLALHLFGTTGELAPGCPPFLAASKTCLFTAPADASQLRLVLRYDRPLGGIRLEGTVRLMDFALELQR